MPHVFWQGIGPKRHFRMEGNCGIVEWVDAQGWPTLNSLLPDGSYWVYRYVWPNAAGGAVRREAPTELLSLTKTVIQADGVRTIALELMLDDVYDALITDSDFTMTVSYIAADGSGMQVESTPLTFGSGATALATSSASWTNYAGSFNGTHVPRKLSLTTSKSVDQNSEVEARLYVHREPGTSQSLFINPELTIT
jgi:hypothetical protein